MRIDPSSSSGRNSVPSRLITHSERAKMTRAVLTVNAFRFMNRDKFLT